MYEIIEIMTKREPKIHSTGKIVVNGKKYRFFWSSEGWARVWSRHRPYEASETELPEVNNVRKWLIETLGAREFKESDWLHYC